MKYNYDYIRSIVGGRVRRLGVLVWPDSDGMSATDVQLHLEVDCIDGICRELTCRTDADGQTLRIEQEHWSDGLPLSKLDERKAIWSSPEFWNRPNGQAYELFETAYERNFGIGEGSTVTGVHLVKFVDDQGEPTGVVIEFDSKIRLWSAPSANGNYVSANHEDFAWPKEIELMPLSNATYVMLQSGERGTLTTWFGRLNRSIRTLRERIPQYRITPRSPSKRTFRGRKVPRMASSV